MLYCTRKKSFFLDIFWYLAIQFVYIEVLKPTIRKTKYQSKIDWCFVLADMIKKGLQVFISLWYEKYRPATQSIRYTLTKYQAVSQMRTMSSVG